MCLSDFHENTSLHGKKSKLLSIFVGEYVFFGGAISSRELGGTR